MGCALGLRSASCGAATADLSRGGGADATCAEHGADASDARLSGVPNALLELLRAELGG